MSLSQADCTMQYGCRSGFIGPRSSAAGGDLMPVPDCRIRIEDTVMEEEEEYDESVWNTVAEPSMNVC